MSSGSGNDPWAPDPDDAPKGWPSQSHPGQPHPPPYPAQPFPGAHPPGFPPQGFPPQGFPPQGFPPQGFPPQGFPPPGAGPRFDPADPLVSNTFAGWWQRGMAVIRRGWKLLLTLQLIGIVPVALFIVPATILIDRANAGLSVNAAAGTTPDVGVLLPGLGVVLLATLAGILLYGVVYLATARAVISIATGRPTTVGAELLAGLRRLPAFIGWGTLASLIMLVAVLLCVLPVFYVGAVFVLLQAVIMFERGNAISRCFQLFHTDPGVAAGRIATVWGFGIAVGLAIGVVVTVVTIGMTGTDLAYDGGSLAASIISGLLQTLGSVATAMLLAPLTVLTYTDLRARREPFTTDQLLA